MGFRLTQEATHTLLSTLHASPQDAVSLARDVRSRHSLAMHFGTFCGSEDESQQPLFELVEALLESRTAEEGDALARESGELGQKEAGVGSRGSGLDLREYWKTAGGFGAIDVGQTVLIPVS